MGKFSSVAVAALVAGASAFPSAGMPGVEQLAKRAEQLKYTVKRDGISSGAGTVPDPAAALHLFDAEKQYISTTGEHAWVEPLETDQRGPCPGLNAMANHGYIPHSGVGTIEEFIQGCYDAVGMGLDLGGFLSVYAAIFNGNLEKWSIGGPDDRAAPLLGTQALGLSGSHNNYEGDVSPTRPDLYEYGNDYVPRPEQFAKLYQYQSALSNEESNYNLEVLQEFRSYRWDQSLMNNPYFFSAIFAGILVQPAAYTFIYRFMANHSEEYPDGRLSQDVLKSWFAMEGPDENGDFTNKQGYERIPDNWYKRPVGDEYTIPFFLLDVIQEATVYPKFLSLGGNTNGTNTFVGVDPSDLTDGVFNADTLLKGDNLQCFVFQVLLQDGPDFLLGPVEKTLGALDKFNEAVTGAMANLSCPHLTNIKNDQFNIYPGYVSSGGVGKPTKESESGPTVQVKQ